jgi:hypothetical protein
VTFFNPKEEVLDIQLTQYGRHLLSKGKMKPAYYAFFDEGVVYESISANSSRAAAYEENRYDAEGRIQNDTPSRKSQTCFTGREEFLFDGINDLEDRQELGIYEKMFALTDPLGTSELGTTQAPYFVLNLLDGKINGSVNHMTGSTRTEKTGSISTTFTPYSHQLLKIPQINIDVEYKIAAVDPQDPQIKFTPEPNLQPQKIYKNDLAIAVGSDNLLILVEEGNTTCKHKNFDIEVFDITGEAGNLGEEVLTPMAFRKPLKMIKDNILLDPKEARRDAGLGSSGAPEIDSSYVEYFLDIKTDNKISKGVICSNLSKIKKKGQNIYSPCGVEFNCPDVKDVIVRDIYASDADPDSCPD